MLKIRFCFSQAFSECAVSFPRYITTQRRDPVKPIEDHGLRPGAPSMSVATATAAAAAVAMATEADGQRLLVAVKLFHRGRFLFVDNHRVRTNFTQKGAKTLPSAMTQRSSFDSFKRTPASNFYSARLREFIFIHVVWLAVVTGIFRFLTWYFPLVFNKSKRQFYPM